MHRRSRRALVPSLVFAALVLIGAGPQGPQASSPQSDAPTRGREFAAGPAALDALQQRLGGPLEILKVVVSSDSVEIEARDPRQSTHVDRYDYAEGKLEGPEPVAVGRNQRQLQARLFPLKASDLSRLPELLPRALAEVKAEDGRVVNVTLERNEHDSWSYDITTWTKPMFRVHVSGPRSGGYVEFQLDGKRGRVVRW
jgi:hypothetical protein